MKRKSNSSFDNFEMEPSPELWKKIEERLPKKKKRWFLLWFFGVVFTSAIIYSQFESTIQNLSPDKIVENNSSVQKNIKNSNKILNNKESSKNTSTENEIISIDKIISAISFDKIKGESRKSPLAKSNSLIQSEKITDNRFENKSYSKNQIVVNENISEWKILSTIHKKIEANSTDKNIRENIFDEKIIKPLSRWTIFIGSEMVYTHHSKRINSTDGSTNKITGLSDLSFNAGVGYDINSRIKISLAVSIFTSGMEHNSLNTIVLHGTAGAPDNTYSIISPAGNLSGIDDEFHSAYFGNTDSVLFHQSASVVPIVDTVRYRNFSLEHEFDFIEFPVMISYKPIERKITPYVGIFFSTSFLNDQRVFLNGKRLNYKYENKLDRIMYSTGLCTGINFNLTRHISLYLQGSYSQSLNSITNGENSFKPYFLRAGGGVSYRLNKAVK